MTTILLALPDATHDAIDHANGALRRAKARLAAATLFAHRARRRLEKAEARAEVLQVMMRDVKYASRPTT
jgi:hypothetical protein